MVFSSPGSVTATSLRQMCRRHSAVVVFTVCADLANSGPHAEDVCKIVNSSVERFLANAEMDAGIVQVLWWEQGAGS